MNWRHGSSIEIPKSYTQHESVIIAFQLTQKQHNLKVIPVRLCETLFRGQGTDLLEDEDEPFV